MTIMFNRTISKQHFSRTKFRGILIDPSHCELCMKEGLHCIQFVFWLIAIFCLMEKVQTVCDVFSWLHQICSNPHQSCKPNWPLHHKDDDSYDRKGRSIAKKVLFGHCPNGGGGGWNTCPNGLWHFFSEYNPL